MSDPEPLWKLMLHVRFPATSWRELKGTQDEGEEIATQLRVVANVVAPNEPEPKMADFGSFSDFMSAVARWNARREIRGRLLSEADEAEAGE
jgi:hypothetical protein